MSEKNFRDARQNRQKISPNLEIALTNLVLNIILPRGWVDYDNFSSSLAFYIIKAKPKSRNELIEAITSFQHPFFKLNCINKNTLIEIFPTNEALQLFKKNLQIDSITFLDVFTETARINLSEGEKLVATLRNIPEHEIQQALVNSLRDKNATNCVGRNKDTVLEVGDLEHFLLEIKSIPRTFGVVVKGHNSVSGKTITWKDIAHQINRIYNRTNPDHILVILAKNLTDSVVSELVQYSKSIGNENLVILADPLTLARFLRARNLI
jgi:hypothetical protein